MAQVKLTKREERGHEHEHEHEHEIERQRAEAVETTSVAPAVDVYKNEEELLLVADLPGISRENLHVQVDGEHLTIEGFQDKQKGERGRELACEFRPHDYRRRFTLPEGIDPEKITAQLASGILTMHLPKAAGVKARKIEVKAIS